MSSLATFNALAHAASSGPVNAAFAICRDACLPNTTAILPRVHALRLHYRRATGRTLDTDTAIRVLDRLQAERDDMPFPVAFAAAADYLVRAGYTPESIHDVIGHVARHGTTAGLGKWLAPEHRGEVEALVPGAGPRRGQWGHNEDEGDE